MIVAGVVAACAVLAWWDVARRLLAYLRARDEASHRKALEADVATLSELVTEHEKQIRALGVRAMR